MEKRNPHYDLSMVQSAFRLRGADAFTAIIPCGFFAMFFPGIPAGFCFAWLFWASWEAGKIVGVTSFCRFWLIGEGGYHSLLNFFRFTPGPARN